MIPISKRWMTMGCKRLLLTFPAIVILLVLGIPNSGFSVYLPQSINMDLLQNVRSVLLDPAGKEFIIQWEYSFEGDIWSGDGSLQILDRDYLRLTLPYQEILIQKSVVMTWFKETDQVIIDYFDRHNPSNLFSIFLGEFSGYSVIESEFRPDSIVNVKLLNKSLVGFEELEMLINQNTWLPISILAKAGEDMMVTIKIIETKKLQNVDVLKNAILRGTEVIDLRE